MHVTNENIFVGARISQQDKTFSVIKVNAKSFYATSMSYDEYLDKWDSKFKGVTFKEFCKVWEINSYKYTDSFEITEDELKRKNTVSSSSSYKLDYRVKRTIETEITNRKKRRKRVRFLQFESGSKTIRVIEENGNNYLLNIDNDYVLFSLDTKDCIKLCSVFEYNEEKIPWEKLQTT